MISSEWQSWFAAGGEKRREPDPDASMKRLKEYEKYKNRLMDTGAHVLYGLADLDPADFHIEELRQLEQMRITQESIVASENLCGAFYHHYPPKGTVLTDEPSIWAGRMILTWDSLFLPLSVNNIGISGLPDTGKSTLAMILIPQQVHAGSLAICWDIKGTWRRLLQFPAMADRTIVLSVDELLLLPPSRRGE